MQIYCVVQLTDCTDTDIIVNPQVLSSVLTSPVIFELGQHNARSLHADVDVFQVEAERVCELHSRHHLLINFAFTGHLKYTQSVTAAVRLITV